MRALMPTGLGLLASLVLASASLVLVSATPAGAGVRLPLEWSACADDAAVECATLEVLLDPADPGSRTLHLPVRRVGAANPQRRVGTLVTIAGGPGQRGTEWVQRSLHTPAIHDAFDIVSWDPRGTSSDSIVDCIRVWDPYAGLDRSPDEATEQAMLDARTSALARGCREAHGEMLPYLGTRPTALDLERLRQALQEDRLSLLGVSYGSEVALAYATRYPHRVRAIVLDGYSDPNQSPADLQLEQAASFERELDALLAGCAADPSCPLGRAGHPGAALDGLLRELDEAPLVSEDTRVLTQSDAHEAIVGALLWGGEARTHLLGALAGATGGDGSRLLEIADDIRDGYTASGLTMGAFSAIECADDGAYWETLDAAAVADLTERVHQAAPRLGQWLWSPPLDPDLPPVGLCAMQPFYLVADDEPLDAAGAGPVLVLATTGDPTTPLSAARRALADLEEAVLLPLEADHHLAYHAALQAPDEPRYACVIDAVQVYLIERRLPPDGYACG